MKIIVTDCNLRKSFDVFNVLARYYGIADLVVCNNKNYSSKILEHFAYKGAIFRRLRNKKFEEDFANLLKEFSDEDIVFLPIEEESISHFFEFLKKNRQNFDNLKYLLPHEDIFEMVRDKDELNKYCVEHDYHCPLNFDSSNIYDANRDKHLILKPKTGSGARGIIYLPIGSSIEIDQVENINDYCIQEFIPNNLEVYAGLYLINNNELISFYSHRRLRTYPSTGGVSVYSETVENEIIKEMGFNILKSLQWNGVVMIEFIYDQRDDKYKIIEFNPRFWGSILLSEKCGSKMINSYVQSALNSDNNINRNYSYVKSYIRWIVPYEIIYWIINFKSPIEAFKNYNDTCYINFTYSKLVKSLSFIFVSIFNFDNLLKFIGYEKK